MNVCSSLRCSSLVNCSRVLIVTGLFSPHINFNFRARSQSKLINRRAYRPGQRQCAIMVLLAAGSACRSRGLSLGTGHTSRTCSCDRRGLGKPSLRRRKERHHSYRRSNGLLCVRRPGVRFNRYRLRRLWLGFGANHRRSRRSRGFNREHRLCWGSIRWSLAITERRLPEATEMHLLSRGHH
jgi:hypothetical protein